MGYCHCDTIWAMAEKETEHAWCFQSHFAIETAREVVGITAATWLRAWKTGENKENPDQQVRMVYPHHLADYEGSIMPQFRWAAQANTCWHNRWHTVACFEI